MIRQLKPWTYGPFEILLHAELHYRVGEDFDRRIAMVGFDNAIEVADTSPTVVAVKNAAVGGGAGSKPGS